MIKYYAMDYTRQNLKVTKYDAKGMQCYDK